MRTWLLSAALLLALAPGGLWAQPGGREATPPDWRGVRNPEDLPWVARALLAEGHKDQARAALGALANAPRNPANAYQKALAARSLAEGAAAFAGSDPAFSASLTQAAEASLSELPGWLTDFGKFEDLRNIKEPLWLHEQPEAVAQAVLAWVSLEKLHSDPTRREHLTKFAQGLQACQRKECNQYPFMAHVCFGPSRPDVPAFAPIPSGGQAPGAMWVPGRSCQVQALVAASRLLGDHTMLEAATSEALGLWAHLAVSGRIPYCFSPRPEGPGSALGASVLVDNFNSLFQATQNPLYQVLAGFGAAWLSTHPAKTASEQAAAALVKAHLGEGAAYLQAADLTPPLTYQVMEAEEGKAVKKAFDSFDVTYPSGAPGKVAKVGGGDMFWMRFDVDREDDYDFYLVFLKSPLEGGLVSIMMRIDGDKIFQVPFGGASEPYMDMEFVDGPRTLRQGPHSFGIRFSGLLMTQPAILDSVIAWPVVERRYFKLGDKHCLLLHNHSPQPARTSFGELDSWPPGQTICVDGSGVPASVTRQSDKRRHKEYIVLPPGGTALLQWRPGAPRGGSTGPLGPGMGDLPSPSPAATPTPAAATPTGEDD